MAAIISHRSVLGLTVLAPAWTRTPLLFSSCRYESTARRTRKRLRVKPDPSFSSESSNTRDHIIFNPPSSAPSVYHTPLKFLPSDDKRRQLRAELDQKNSAPLDDTPLPPPVHKPYKKTYHLNEDDLQEIRRLRLQDPEKWSRLALAKKFRCSSLFIGMVCEATQKRKDEQIAVLDAVKANWGRRRREAREDRTRRRELWGRDA